MNKVLNTKFESYLRVLFLLAALENKKISSERIICYDFLSIYAATFKISSKNINGNSPYYLGEFNSKRFLIKEAIKDLVVDGMISVIESHEGFFYMINPKGLKFAKDLKLQYSNDYMYNILLVDNFALNYSDSALLSFISKYDDKSQFM